jgi:DNA mismatch repair protein MutS2
VTGWSIDSKTRRCACAHRYILPDIATRSSGPEENIVNDHSLSLLEFDRVAAANAGHAACAPARARLERWRPFTDAARRERECGLLAEALERQREPGEWCAVGEADVEAMLDDERDSALDGEALVALRAWLDAGRVTREAWQDEAALARHPALADCVSNLPALEPLRVRLTDALEPDGRVSDAASPALKRARTELAHGERALEQRLTSWVRAFGDNAHVTRHADRFVAVVPAAGFSRKRGIVHDVSGSGQSLYVEPLEICEANNQLLENRATVIEEERRILRELAALVLDRAEDVLALFRALVALDTLRARARWAATVDGIALTPRGERLSLRAVRHPLLAMSRPGQVVPLDLELSAASRLLLVSGPNMGGKTVLLKTVGLAVALAHAALPVPAAEGTCVPVIDRILGDLGDEQSVDRGLSTFAGHLQRLAEMAEAAGPRTLLLADELGAGTDPEEGAALGRALIERFSARGAWGVITTHLGSLKRVAGEVEGVVNGSMEFDLETLSPRYRFIAGIPGASHALSVAARLGLPPEVIRRAGEMVSDESRALERLLGDVQESRRRLEIEREAARESAASAEHAAGEHRRATEVARQTLEDLRRRLTAESEALLARTRELWQTIQREARRSDKSRTSADELRTAMETAEREVTALQRTLDEALPSARSVALPSDAIAIGHRVRITDLGVEAEVVSAPDAEGKVVLQRGSWTIHSHVSRLAAPPVARTEAGSLAPRAHAAYDAPEEAPALEVDLRGMEVDEALRAVDSGLDRAVLAGLSELRIIHGIGKGILRAAVERHLRGHPQVALARMGEGHEGGRGATVATLR